MNTHAPSANGPRQARATQHFLPTCLVALLSLFIGTLPLRADNNEPLKPNLKYGRPSKAELNLATYEPDTTAAAVCLLRRGETNFKYTDGFQLVNEVWMRVKVLKPQGVSYADVSIPYYSPANRNEARETAHDVDGCSYNVVDGKTVKTRLERSQVSDEQVDAYTRVLKFSLPNVKEGTVIEYHYKIVSDYVSYLDAWMMQSDIPVLYNEYKINIPLVYIYDIEFRKRELIEMSEEESSMQATQHRESGVSRMEDTFTLRTRKLTFVSRNLPALSRKEPFCWCPDDYRVQVNFNLQGTNFPTEGYKPLSRTWADVDKSLLEEKEAYEESTDGLFGVHLRDITNPYREEMTQTLAGKDLTFEQRVAAAFALLKQKLSWNGEYLLYAENPLRAVKEGRGSNAELNFILISMLKDLGLKAYPVVMSLRSRGMMPVHFPSEQRLNTFAVAVRHPQANRFVYIDSSMELPLLDVLPTDMLVERARIISNDVPEDKKWVDLSRLSPNRRKTLIEATIDSTLNLRGNIRVVRQGQYASSYLKRKLKGDSNGGGIDKSDVTLSQHTDSTEEAWKAEVTERAALEAPVQSAGGDKLYVNPMVIGLMSENPFTQSERDLPVEFPYPLELSVTSILTLPEGYTVEELPQVRTLSTEDNELYLRYRIRQTEDGKRVVLTCSLGIKRCAYPAQYYPQLQQFFDRVVEASEGVLVLSKQ